MKLSLEHCPMVYYRFNMGLKKACNLLISNIREVHDKIPKKRKKLKPNEMKLILNWKLAGEAQVCLQIKKKI